MTTSTKTKNKNIDFVKQELKLMAKQAKAKWEARKEQVEKLEKSL